MWNIFIPPAMESRPSALSYQNEANPSLNSSVPKFTKGNFQQWIDFQKKRNKAVNKDTWVLLVDFIRSIDADFKEFDESGEYPL
jgi:DCN1-like protein 1/2